MYERLLTKILVFNCFCFVGNSIKFPYGLTGLAVTED